MERVDITEWDNPVHHRTHQIGPYMTPRGFLYDARYIYSGGHCLPR